MGETRETAIARAERRLVPKPVAIKRLEARIADAVPLSANALSLAKLLVITPLLLLTLRQVDVLPAAPALALGLFGLFFALDYLDGLVARARGNDSWFGRVLDRATDYPLLLIISYFCVEAVPVALLMIKLGLDLLLLLLFIRGDGSTENRLRTAMSYSMLLALLCLSQGWAPAIIAPSSVSFLLAVNIAFTALVALRNLDVLQKRFIADALSAINLACGAASIVFAVQGRAEMSLLLLMVGALFDGMDGLAARRWGGTRIGVFADDIADGVNFGVAPGVAVCFAVGGLEGVVVGSLFALFTVSRLIVFTLDKGSADPNYFSGVPSTVGGIIVLCAVILFASQPALVGLLVGVACAQMVSFDTHYRHLGRAVLARKRRLLAAVPSLVMLLVGTAIWGPTIPVALILAANLTYSLFPMARHLARLARGYRKPDNVPNIAGTETAHPGVLLCHEK